VAPGIAREGGSDLLWLWTRESDSKGEPVWQSDCFFTSEPESKEEPDFRWT
jgi:hypothetical protein